MAQPPLSDEFVNSLMEDVSRTYTAFGKEGQDPYSTQFRADLQEYQEKLAIYEKKLDEHLELYGNHRVFERKCLEEMIAEHKKTEAKMLSCQDEVKMYILKFVSICRNLKPAATEDAV